MYGPTYEPEPIEKIRKAQWTVENTRATQAVVDTLIAVRAGIKIVLGGHGGNVERALTQAIDRFKQLDPGVK